MYQSGTAVSLNQFRISRKPFTNLSDASFSDTWGLWRVSVVAIATVPTMEEANAVEAFGLFEPLL